MCTSTCGKPRIQGRNPRTKNMLRNHGQCRLCLLCQPIPLYMIGWLDYSSPFSHLRWNFSSFMQMFLTWGPWIWSLASVRPPLFHSVSFSSLCRKTDHWLLLVRRKLPLIHWFLQEIRLIGTERRAQVRPTYLIIETIGAMGRTSGQTQIKLSLLRSVSLKEYDHRRKYEEKRRL
jgi:hypothetical protein